MADKDIHINIINNRQFILSPAVQSGRDKESSNKDFYQEDVDNPNLGRLGSGMKVLHKKTQIPYTILSIEKEKVIKLNLQEKINSTIDLMYKTSHPYLFRLLNHYETEGHLFLIFEPYDGDSLYNRIQQGKCDLQTILKYFVEILLGIQHMHTFQFYDINIFPENILIGECVKLTDYGLKISGKNDGPKREIRHLRARNTTYDINAYSSPEEILGIMGKEQFVSGPKTDSWNCGILLFEMLTNFKSPFRGDTDELYINSLLNGEIDLSLINDDFCKDLISKLIQSNPKDRIDIEEILNMEYIKNINIEQPEIDPSDNIINPDEEERENENNENNENDSEENEKKEEIIKKLKEENEYLKKALELCKGLDGEKNNEANKEKSKTLENKNGESESIEDSNKNILKLLDNNNEQKNNTSSSSSSESDLDNESESSSEDMNNDNLFVRCEKYKEKYLNSKKKITKLKKKIKNLNDEIEELRKEKNNIREQKILNILTNFEKVNISKINSISELSDIIINSVNSFRESQQNLENLIDKLISDSAEEHISLVKENKKYIDDKGKVFFDTLENLSNTGTKQIEIELNKEKEERKKKKKKKNLEIAELKSKYEIIKQRELLLNEKIKILEERNKATADLNESLIQSKNIMKNFGKKPEG